MQQGWTMVPPSKAAQEAKQESLAFVNARELRKKLRKLHESCKNVSSYSLLEARKAITNEYVNQQKNPLLKQAIELERQAHASAPGSKLGPEQRLLLDRAYSLVQSLPMYPAAPEGEAENKLRAIEALLKNIGPQSPVERLKQALDSINNIIDPGKLKAKIKAEQLAAEKAAKAAKEAAKAAKEKAEKEKAELNAVLVTQSPSKFHLTMVDHSQPPIGIGMSLANVLKLPDNAPVTWGSYQWWVDKGEMDHGATKTGFKVHRVWWNAYMKWLKTQPQAPLHATVLEGDEK